MKVSAAMAVSHGGSVMTRDDNGWDLIEMKIFRVSMNVTCKLFLKAFVLCSCHF